MNLTPSDLRRQPSLSRSTSTRRRSISKRPRANTQRRRMLHECLESRLLLAFDGVTPLFSTTANVTAATTAEVALRFTGGRDTAVLGFLVTPNNSALNPSAPSVSNETQSVRSLDSFNDVGDLGQSFALVQLSLGGTIDYQVQVGGESGTSGSFTLDVFLIGDGQGDGIVSDFELLLTTGAVTQYLGAGNLVTQTFYKSKGIDFRTDLRRPEMDSNLDTIVDGTDLRQVEINHGKPAISVDVADGIALAQSFTFVDTNGNNRADIGETGTFIYTVTNTGSTPLTDVVLMDTINGIIPLSDNGGDGNETLAPRTTETGTSVRIITAQDIINGTIVNNPTVTGTPPGRPPIISAPTPGGTPPIVLINPSIRVLKSFTLNDQNSNGRGDVGESITYQFNVTNTGNDRLTNVSLVDDVEGTLTLTDAASDGVTVLAPGVTETASSTHVITQSEFNSGSLINTATVSGTPSQGTNVSSQTTVTVPFFFSAVAVQKTFQLTSDVNANGRADVGDSITYSYSVTNSGNVSLSALSLVDDIEGTLVLTDVGADGVAVLAPGVTETATSVHVVTQTEFNAGALTNLATATATGEIGGVVNGTATVTVPFIQPSIAITKSANLTTDANNNGQADVGDVITYRYSVTNNGNSRLTSVTINDDRQGVITLADSAGDGVGVLIAGATETATSTRTISQADFNLGSLTNTVTATGSPSIGNAVSAQATATVLFVSPSISVTKTSTLTTDTNANGRADVGDVITYRYVVRNTGDVLLSGIVVSDDVQGTIALPDTGGDGAAVLAVGASETATSPFTVTQAAFQSGSLTNTVTVTGNPPTGASVSGTATLTVNFASPAITVQKTASLTIDTNNNGRIDAGDQVTYSYVVTNTGNTVLTSVTANDDLEGVILLADVGGDGVQTLAIGASENGTTTRTISQQDFNAGSLVNTVTVVGTPPVGTAVSGQNSATITFIAPAIAVTKTSMLTTDTNANGRPDVGDVITYTYNVTNTGDSTLTAVTLVDNVDGTLVIADTAGDGANVLASGVTELSSSTHTVTQAEFTAGTLNSTVTATGTPTIGNAVTGTSSLTVNLAVPGIAVAKAFTITTDTNNNGRADVGDVVTYSVQVTNNGSQPLSGVTVVDDREGTLVLADTAGDGVGLLAIGAVELATSAHTVTQAEFDAGLLTNTVTVTGTPTSGAVVTAQASATVTFGSPAITVTKTSSLTTDTNGNNIADLGDVITYSYVVTNSGNVALNSVSLVDDIDGTITLADVGGDGVATIAAGAIENGSITHMVTQSEINSGTLTNIATATGTSPGLEVVSNTATVTIDLCNGYNVDQSMTLVDTSGNPLTGPIIAGSSFGIKVHFEDLTRTGSQGAISGYLDILFDNTLVQVDSITAGPGYNPATNTVGTFSNATGLIDEFGFTDGFTPPTDNTVFIIMLTALAGQSGTARFTSNRAENVGDRASTTILGNFAAQNDLTCYRGLDVVIAAAEGEQFDVNRSGSVTSLDALIVINDLVRGAAEGEQFFTPQHDVNRDGQVSALDALNIINYIRAQELDRQFSSTAEFEQLSTVVGSLDDQVSVNVASKKISSFDAPSELASVQVDAVFDQFGQDEDETSDQLVTLF